MTNEKIKYRGFKIFRDIINNLTFNKFLILPCLPKFNQIMNLVI